MASSLQPPSPSTPRSRRLFISIVVLLLILILVFSSLLLLVLLQTESIREFLPPFALNVIVFIGSTVIIVLSLSISSRHARMTETRLRATIRDYDRRSTQLQVAARIARDATAEEDLQAVLHSAVELVHERFGFYHAGIFLLDDTNEYAELRAVAGGPASHEMLQRNHRLKVGEEGIIGYVTKTGIPRIALDVSRDSHHYLNPWLPQTRSEMSVPLKVGGKMIGALDVQSLHENAFDHQDVEIIQVMADLMAIAIYKAYLLQKLQASAKELESRVEERTSELTIERAQLNAILQAMNEGVVYQEGSHTLYTNSAFHRLLGYTPNEWDDIVKELRTGESEVIRSDTSYEELIRYLRIIETWRGEAKLTRKDSTNFDASISVRRITPQNDERWGVVSIIRDISQEKALQEQKTRFVAYASHELRTPLTNLKTRLYLMDKQPHRYQEHFQIVQQVVARMQRLVDDLLDKTRFERGRISLERELGIVQDTVRDVMTTQQPEADRKKQAFTLMYPPDPLYVLMDKDRMTQVLTNLVTNAINYTPEEGMIHIGIKEIPDNRVEILVEDTGVGIPDHQVVHLFEPFFRADNVESKGTGLGLNITRQIVELHGGEIAVESEVGKGSRFFVRLNLIRQETHLAPIS